MSCVLSVASVSGLSIHDCPFGFLTVVKELRSEMLCHLPIQVN
jgi:hypothetical protein